MTFSLSRISPFNRSILLLVGPSFYTLHAMSQKEFLAGEEFPERFPVIAKGEKKVLC